MANRYPKALVMAVVGGILVSGRASITTPIGTKLLSDLIKSGRVRLDRQNGKLTVESPIFEILEDSGVIEEVSPKDILLAAPGSTTGGCGV